MAKHKPLFDEINDTLNTLLVNVFSQVNYASKIATETGKSIPVVFRQLEDLVRANLLQKSRSGQKVEYGIQWKTIAFILAKIIEEDIERTKTQLSDNPRHARKEDVQKLMLRVLEYTELQEMFTLFFVEIGTQSKIIPYYLQVNLRECLSHFLDALGMLTPNQQKIVLGRFRGNKQEKMISFLRLAAMHHALSNHMDPRRTFIAKLLQ